MKQGQWCRRITVSDLTGRQRDLPDPETLRVASVILVARANRLSAFAAVRRAASTDLSGYFPWRVLR